MKDRHDYQLLSSLSMMFSAQCGSECVTVTHSMTLHDELRTLLFPGEAHRLEIVVSFLKQEDIDCIRELAGFFRHIYADVFFETVPCLCVGCPEIKSLDGVDALLDTEVGFLENVR